MTDTQERRVLHSAAAAIFSQFTRVGVTFLTVMLLRRMIEPAEYGLWDWAEGIILLLAAIRDLGMPVHVLRLNPRPYGNFLATQVVGALVLVGVLFVAAPVLAGDDPLALTAVPVLRLLGLFLLIEGLAKVARVYFEGELELRKTVVAELARNLTFSATALTLAWYGYGVWSLVVAYLLAAALFAILLWWRAAGRIPLHWERGRTLTLVRESLPLASIWLLLLMTMKVDLFILKGRFDFVTVGPYAFALFVAFLVPNIMLEPIGRVLYPAAVNLRDEPARLFETYRLATLSLLAVVVPAGLFLFVNAEMALTILGGGRWLEGAPYLRILCFAPLMDPFSILGGDVLMACHRERTTIVGSALTLSWLVIAGIVATGAYGAHGMAFVHLLPLGAVVVARGVYRFDPPAFSNLMRDLGRLYLVAIVPFVAVFAVAGGDRRVAFGLSFVALALIAVAYAKLFGGAFQRFFGRRPQRP